MAFETFVLYIAAAFITGFIVGLIFLAGGSGSSNVTREEARRINQVLEKIDQYPKSTLCLWSEGKLIDSVNIGEENW